jgi:sugar phosphate permease
MEKSVAVEVTFTSELVRAMQRYRVWIFLAISAAYLVSYFHRAAPAVVAPEIIRDLGVQPAALGFLTSMYFWAYAAAMLPAGVLADTWGSRKTMSVFILVAAIGGFVFGAAPGVDTLAVGRFLVGFGVGFIYVPAVRVLADWYKPDELATYSGVLLAVGNIGALISAAPLVALMDAIGWRNSFYVVGVFTVLAAIFTYAILRNKPSEMGFPTPRDLMGLAPAPPAPKVRLGEALKVVFGNPQFYLLGLLLFSYYGTFMGVGSLWAGPYLQNVYGLTKQTAGNIIMMFPLGMVFGCPLSGYISDKIMKSRKKVLLLGCFFHTLSYIPLVFFTHNLSVISLYYLFLWYGLSGGFFVSCFACAKETCAPRFAGTAMGSLNIFIFVGGAFYQQIMGIVIGKFPVVKAGVYSTAAYQAAFAVPLAGLILGMILYSFFREKPIT